jgi:hypothetical protein
MSGIFAGAVGLVGGILRCSRIRLGGNVHSVVLALRWCGMSIAASDCDRAVSRDGGGVDAWEGQRCQRPKVSTYASRSELPPPPLPSPAAVSTASPCTRPHECLAQPERVLHSSPAPRAGSAQCGWPAGGRPHHLRRGVEYVPPTPLESSTDTVFQVRMST